jgi:hypothetical protein
MKNISKKLLSLSLLVFGGLNISSCDYPYDTYSDVIYEVYQGGVKIDTKCMRKYNHLGGSYSYEGSYYKRTEEACRIED